MPSGVETMEPRAFGISARMARALADPWRVRILAELSVRPLSPSRFVEEVGGDLTEIARYFRQLAEWGYIELIEERPGRRQGAAIEHVYQGIQKAHFDTSTWEGVPRSQRDAASRAAVSSYFARISEAVAERTFDEELDRHLSWDGVALDAVAWRELGFRLDEILDQLSQLELSNPGLGDLNEETIPSIVGLAAFRSIQSPALMLAASRRHESPAVACAREPFGLGPKLAKALSNKWRCRILMELTSRPLSPSQFVNEVGGSKTHIARCFRELAGWGFIEIFEERRGGKRRGGVELIYRNARSTYFDTPTWKSLPRLVREEMSQAFLNSYFERVTEAIEGGTFDADKDRHFSWKPALFSRSAWTQVGEILDDVLAWLPELEAESLTRTKAVERDLIPTIVGLASFRSPPSGGVR
jgi:DNA-binding transcriptional ArsR family regulator